jgi:hypothetical protein
LLSILQDEQLFELQMHGRQRYGGAGAASIIRGEIGSQAPALVRERFFR